MAAAHYVRVGGEVDTLAIAGTCRGAWTQCDSATNRRFNGNVLEAQSIWWRESRDNDASRSGGCLDISIRLVGCTSGQPHSSCVD